MFSLNAKQGRQGFSITFNNGYTVSVQWGHGNYCSNRDAEEPGESSTAETAVMVAGGFVPVNDEDVQGYQSADEIAALISHVAKLPPIGQAPSITL